MYGKYVSFKSVSATEAWSYSSNNFVRLELLKNYASECNARGIKNNLALSDDDLYLYERLLKTISDFPLINAEYFINLHTGILEIQMEKRKEIDEIITKCKNI